MSGVQVVDYYEVVRFHDDKVGVVHTSWYFKKPVPVPDPGTGETDTRSDTTGNDPEYVFLSILCHVYVLSIIYTLLSFMFLFVSVVQTVEYFVIFNG